MSIPTPAVRAALVSVGGSPAPILHVLRLHQPPHVWYFCSADSRTHAEAIQAELDWHPQARFIEIDRFEDLGPCYRELRRKIPEILAETKVNPAEVLVDYTGGTKTMSAALVLAAIELFAQFSYVGGQQREKAGLGVVVDGKERVLYQGNPWTELAIREIERARDLWAGCRFDAAAQALRSVASRTTYPLRLEAVATLAEGLAARHRLDFSAAKGLLKTAQGRLRAMFEGRLEAGPVQLAQAALKVCETCSETSATETLLGELLDNTLRTAAQNRFEDAAARLYRAMEMQGQLWLAAATDDLFVNGRCRPDRVACLPDPLKLLDFCRPDPRGEIRLSLEQLFLALAALGHPQSQAIAADLAARSPDGETKSRWRAATEQRNTSILAHGVRAVGADGFARMRQIAIDFLGFTLDQEAHPIAPLDPRWFD